MPRARKAPAPVQETPVGLTTEDITPVEETESITEITAVDETDETPTAKRRGGRQTSPLTVPLRNWEKAKSKADKARSAFEKVQHLADQLDEAVAEELAAYGELQAALKEAGA